MQHMANETTASHCVIHVLLPEGKAGLMPKDSEEVMEQIRMRATFIGPILESILNDPHCLTHAEYDQ